MADHAFTPSEGGPDTLTVHMAWAGELKLRGHLATAVAAPAVVVGPSAPDTKGLPTRSSDSIVDGVGINVHFDWYNSNYAPKTVWKTGLQDEVLIPALKDLGVRHVRQGLSWTKDVSDKLKAAGFKTLINDAGNKPVEEIWAFIKANHDPAWVWGIEGVNEPADAAWARARMARLIELVRADRAWDGVKLLGPSVHTDATRRAYGDPLPRTDYRNIHPYPGGNMPEDGGLGLTLKVTPGAPLPGVATEDGYHTNTSDRNWWGVSERAAAIYLPRLILDSLAGPTPVEKLFIYELLCHDLASETNATEHALGLLASDGTRRAHYRSVQALLQTLADPGSPFGKGPLDVAVGTSPNLRYVPLARRDGSFDLCLWQPASVYDAASKKDVVVETSVADVRFSRVFRRMQVLAVNDQVPAFREIAPGKKMAVPVDAGVTIVRLTP